MSGVNEPRFRFARAYNPRMLWLRLFAALAALLLLAATVQKFATRPAIDVAFHDLYFVLTPAGLEICGAISSLLFGGVYFIADRVMRRPLDQSLAIIHFVAIVLAILLAAGAMRTLAGAHAQIAESYRGRAMMALWLGIASFFIGWTIFAINVAWAAMHHVSSARKPV